MYNKDDKNKPYDKQLIDDMVDTSKTFPCCIVVIGTKMFTLHLHHGDHASRLTLGLFYQIKEKLLYELSLLKIALKK